VPFKFNLHRYTTDADAAAHIAATIKETSEADFVTEMKKVGLTKCTGASVTVTALDEGGNPIPELKPEPTPEPTVGLGHKLNPVDVQFCTQIPRFRIAISVAIRSIPD
jgi:hypothetical protein